MHEWASGNKISSKFHFRKVEVRPVLGELSLRLPQEVPFARVHAPGFFERAHATLPDLENNLPLSTSSRKKRARPHTRRMFSAWLTAIASLILQLRVGEWRSRSYGARRSFATEP